MRHVHPNLHRQSLRLFQSISIGEVVHEINIIERLVIVGLLKFPCSMNSSKINARAVALEFVEDSDVAAEGHGLFDGISASI